VASASEILSVRAGEVIFSVGSPAEHLYVIKSGTVELRFKVSSYAALQEITIDRKIEGDAFGWSATTTPHSFSLSSVAGVDSELIRICRSDLMRLCAENDHFGHVFMKSMADIIGRRLNLIRRMLTDVVQDRLEKV